MPKKKSPRKGAKERHNPQQHTITGMFTKQRTMTRQAQCYNSMGDSSGNSNTSDPPAFKRSKLMESAEVLNNNKPIQSSYSTTHEADAVKWKKRSKLSLNKTKAGAETERDPQRVTAVGRKNIPPTLQKTASEDQDVSPDGVLECTSHIDIDTDITKLAHDPPSSSTSSYETVSSKSKESDIDASSVGDAEEKPSNIYRVPYYLENFLLVLQSVVDDQYYADLFDKSDRIAIHAFMDLNENAQKVYVRLFSRKYRWILKGKIAYPKIAEDLTDYLNELVSSGLLMDENDMNDLSEILNTLPAPDVKTLAKSLKLNPNALREELVQTILLHAEKPNITTFFGRISGGTGQMITKRAKTMLGHSYKLHKEKRHVFIRITMLFALFKTQGDEDENAGGQQLLFQMLTSNIGRVTYPSYNIKRHSKIFLNRDDLMSYGTALQSETDMLEAIENKEFEDALSIYRKAKTIVAELRSDKATENHHRRLPEFLRVYSALSAYIRVISLGVEVLQTKKHFEEAVDQLYWLINLELYHRRSLGMWYERLALNLDYHLKKPSEALDMIEKGLGDERVRTGRRLSLWLRAQKICNSPSCKKLKHRWHDFASDPMSFVQETPKTVIQCQRMSSVVPGAAGAWLLKGRGSETISSSQESLYLHRVEDVVLVHYSRHGYPDGLHGEGGTFRCLFGLFLWDIIFQDDIPDVFYTPYQLQPLDLGTDQFYLHRKPQIDVRLEDIKNSAVGDLEGIVHETWKRHKDTVCSVINWERFESAEHVCGLVRCMGGKVISGIIERMAVNLRHTSGGVPDLVVWNAETGVFKVVEVKGPNDRLSTKQILWIDYLLALGVDAEVCHVEGVGTKRLVTL